MFTPANIRKNTIFDHRSCKAIPVIIGYQFENPAKIPNTAPIEST